KLLCFIIIALLKVKVAKGRQRPSLLYKVTCFPLYRQTLLEKLESQVKVALFPRYEPETKENTPFTLLHPCLSIVVPALLIRIRRQTVVPLSAVDVTDVT